MSDQISESYIREQDAGCILAEGKTKIIAKPPRTPNNGIVYIVSKNDIPAGDGAKHDIIKDKAELATRTTCNVFRLLRSCGIPVAFTNQISPTAFAAPRCAMLPYEVVVRREAHGSYLKRSPHLQKGHVFPDLVVEFFLKTSGKKWKSHDLVCDDPYMKIDWINKKIYLYDPTLPDIPEAPATPFLTLWDDEVFEYQGEKSLIKMMQFLAQETFLILEKVWKRQERKLVDFEVEFGIFDTQLLLADVIDNDSWRLLDETGAHIDKQVYRDGGDLNEVTAKYRQVADLTDGFESFWGRC
jgi:phosphoribosylaminoimidazole-succinocarboxamide synthase